MFIHYSVGLQWAYDIVAFVAILTWLPKIWKQYCDKKPWNYFSLMKTRAGFNLSPYIFENVNVMGLENYSQNLNLNFSIGQISEYIYIFKEYIYPYILVIKLLDQKIARL